MYKYINDILQSSLIILLAFSNIYIANNVVFKKEHKKNMNDKQEQEQKLITQEQEQKLITSDDHQKNLDKALEELAKLKKEVEGLGTSKRNQKKGAKSNKEA